MPEFGRRQYRETRAETSDMMKWVISSAVAVLIAGLFFSYRLLIHPGNPDPLLNKRGSFAEMVQRNAFSADQLLQHPSISTAVVSIRFGNKVYRVPRNYLVDLDRSAVAPNPRTTTFEIHVLLPGLTPRNANNADRFIEHPYRDGFHDQVSATIRGGQEELDFSERKGQWERRCEQKGQGEFREVESAMPGGFRSIYERYDRGASDFCLQQDLRQESLLHSRRAHRRGIRRSEFGI
ncbi:UNVERIFIED_ORG: hypothetical protein M2193_001923 [Bradyrhizobium japonicum]|jgi:hypothetical protein